MVKASQCSKEFNKFISLIEITDVSFIFEDEIHEDIHEVWKDKNTEK